MATLNIGQKINGGGVINLSYTSGTATANVITTGTNEIAIVDLIAKIANAGNSGNAFIEVKIGAAIVGRITVSAVNTTAYLGHKADPAVAEDVPVNFARFIIPPNSTLDISRQITTNGSAYVRGSYHKIINTQ